jgi:hypothetical protein
VSKTQGTWQQRQTAGLIKVCVVTRCGAMQFDVRYTAVQPGGGLVHLLIRICRRALCSLQFC